MSTALQPRRPLLLALVLAAHAALLLVWQLADQMQPLPALRDAFEPLVLLRLPQPAPAETPAATTRPAPAELTPEATAARPPQPPPQPPRAGAGTQPLPMPSAHDPAQPARGPVDAALQAPAAAALPPAPTAPPEQPASQPLRLDLPRTALPQRNPALDDPRANSAARTVEARVAAVMGDGRWAEERFPDGRRRYRRGTECFIVQPTRAEALFPDASRPPPLVGSC